MKIYSYNNDDQKEYLQTQFIWISVRCLIETRMTFLHELNYIGQEDLWSILILDLKER